MKSVIFKFELDWRHFEMNPDQNLKWFGSDEDENPGYPISPKITVINELKNQDRLNDKEFITLIHEGNGTFTLPSRNLPQNNPDQQPRKGEEEKDKKMSNQGIEEGPTTPKVDTFRNGESARDLSKQEIDGSVHECLSKETPKGKSLTVIISCTNKRIFTNPNTTRKILDGSTFKKYMLGPIEVKGKGKSVKLELRPEIELDIGLKNIKHLANHPVNVWCPTYTKPKNKIGVISPIDLETNLLEEFIPFLRLTDKDTNKCKIVEAKRFNKKGRDLEIVKVVFEGNFLPEKVIWNNLIYRVRPYIFSPLRCYKCQDYGHGANSCSGRSVCFHCRGCHNVDDCAREDDVICHHCKLDHFTGDRCCEFYKHAAIIEDQKQNGEISYHESKVRFNSLNNKTLEELLHTSSLDKNNDIGYSTGNVKNNLTKTTHPYNVDMNNTHSDIPTRNRFEILSEELDDKSECSNSDSYEMMNAYKQSKTPKPRINRNSPKNSNKTYANIVKSSQNGKSDDDDEMMMLNSMFSDRESVKSTQNKNHKDKESNLVRENNINRNNISNNSNIEYSNNEFKDSFFYQILNKVKRFSQKTPLKSFEFWFGFVFDLFDFIGQQFEISE